MVIIKELYNYNNIKIYVPNTSTELRLPFIESKIPAGFPSPADDYMEPEDALKWINKNLSEEEIKELMRPFDSSKMKAHTVKKYIPAKPNDSENSEIIAYYYYPELVDLLNK
jgi:hypothetical protein